ncbi:c-type cytochrome [Parasphingorhabdus sp.]|uniref:c-type cytochrome n=1 Tax=Parasphingorhabdus sp. TaxID=2709688 RepID=UPI003264D34F
MKYSSQIVAFGLAGLLAGCGSEPAPEPVEQIVVREPGEAAPLPAADEAEGTTSPEDLIASGQAAFAVCSGCHAVEEGAPAQSGPNLHGVVGREAGKAEGFAFSEALASSGITWTDSELDGYLENPTGKVPGTTMVAGAMADASQRKAVIAYLAVSGSE